jgi:sugar (pentulose or hexulose) kinase
VNGFIGIDVGTTGVRAIMIDDRGKVVAEGIKRVALWPKAHMPTLFLTLFCIIIHVPL